MSTTWMINGPGQALFMGNPNVSQFGAGGGGQVSPGSGYVPDEVAKMIVKESGLRKSDTIPKRVIVGYLESMGLSPGLATDVAMVLRNMYGVTPTFDESTLYSRSGALIEELANVVNESYPAPFRIDEPEVLFEADEISQYIASEYMESMDEEYDVVLEHFATISPHDFLDIVEFYEWVGPEGFAYLGDLVENGPDGLADEVLEGLCYPHRVMSEDVEYHVGIIEGEADDALSAKLGHTQKDYEKSKGDYEKRRSEIKRKRKERKAAGRSKKAVADAPKPRFIGPRQQSRPALDKAAKRQLKLHAKDVAREDPLAKKAALSKDTGFSGQTAIKGSKEHHAATLKLKAKKQANKAASRSTMKDKGKKALSFLGKVATAPVTIPAKAIGATAGAAAQGHGYLKGRSQGGEANAKDASAKSSAPAANSGETSAKSSAPAAKKSGGIFHRVGQAIKGFTDKFKKKRPGMASKVDGVSSDTGGEVKPPVRESVSRRGSLLSEMRGVLDDVEPVYETEDPYDVFETFEVGDLVGQAVIEALSQLDWDEVCQLASISMLPVEESQALVTAYQNGSGDFFYAWRGAKSRVDMPSALTQESFALLADLSIDEGVVPALVGYSYRAIQVASPDVAMCIEDAYPDLGKTVYGPAGDPREGPQLAKSFMSPHATSTDAPSKDRQVMATRMFADPDVTDREKASKLSDVKNVLGAMRAAAATSGVDPEGMFLNTYRDMHREKARYS